MNLTNLRNCASTVYPILRSILEWEPSFLPEVNQKTSQLAKELLFCCDFLCTVYTGWKVGEELKKKKKEVNQKRHYVDYIVNCLACVAISILFVKIINKILLPKLPLTELLNNSNIPKTCLPDCTEFSLNKLTVEWVKPKLQNLNTSLFFVRTFLEFYHAYLTSSKISLVNALFNAITLIKTIPYRILRVDHSTKFLLTLVDYTYSYEIKYPTLKEFFNVPVQEVKASFFLNTSKISDPGSLIKKIESIYEYAARMFENSNWHRNWECETNYKGYYAWAFPSIDEGCRGSEANYSLTYDIELAQSPSIPLKVFVFHKDKISFPFRFSDFFSLIPRFYYTPAEKKEFAEWIQATVLFPSEIGLIDRCISTLSNFIFRLPVFYMLKSFVQEKI